jgi:hypothetical protein
MDCSYNVEPLTNHLEMEGCRRHWAAAIFNWSTGAVTIIPATQSALAPTYFFP